MPRGVQRSRKDLRHYQFTDIIATLRDKYGVPIDGEDVHDRRGFGDIIVSVGSTLNTEANCELTTSSKGNRVLNNGVELLVEIKTKSSDTLTEAEIDRVKKWQGTGVIAYDFDFVLSELSQLARNKHQREWLKIAREIYETEIKSDLELLD